MIPGNFLRSRQPQTASPQQPNPPGKLPQASSTQCLRLPCSPNSLPPRARNGHLHPLNSFPPLLGFVYTLNSSVHHEAATCLPETPSESLYRVYCAACRGILTPTRATMARPDATRDPDCTYPPAQHPSTWPVDPGCCV